MIQSNSLTETHQIRALCWSYEPIKQEGVVVQCEESAPMLENFSSDIDISKQNKEKAGVPSRHFVQYVLLFCIVHQVAHYPCNTAADVSFSLWSSAAVQKTTTQVSFTIKTQLRKQS